MELKGSDSVSKALADIAKRMGGGQVSVGFMGGATYPDGTPVAAVAFWNEFGSTQSPSRPFFRGMIAKESESWPKEMAIQAKLTNYDGDKVLARMGEYIGGQLKQSINNLTSPPLAPSTVKAKGSPKPLIDTSHMVNSVASSVNGGDIVPVGG